MDKQLTSQLMTAKDVRPASAGRALAGGRLYTALSELQAILERAAADCNAMAVKEYRFDD